MEGFSMPEFDMKWLGFGENETEKKTKEVTEGFGGKNYQRGNSMKQCRDNGPCNTGEMCKGYDAKRPNIPGHCKKMTAVEAQAAREADEANW